MRRGAREGKHMRTHALPPSLPPSTLAHRAPARSRDLVAPPPPPPPPEESTRRAAQSEFPPPPLPRPVVRRPSLLPPFSLPSVLFVFHLFARCVVTLGELPGRRAGRYERASRLRSRFSTFSPSLPLLWLRNRDVVAGKRFPFSGNEAWDLEQYKLVVLVHLYFNPSYH